MPWRVLTIDHRLSTSYIRGKCGCTLDIYLAFKTQEESIKHVSGWIDAKIGQHSKIKLPYFTRTLGNSNLKRSYYFELSLEFPPLA